MKHRLLWKLLLVTTVPVIAVIIGVVWIAFDHLAADYFMVLMDKYMVSPTATHNAFQTAVHRYLLWAGFAALLLALLFSYLLIRHILRPLSQVAAASRRIAGGDFSARVATLSSDEVGDVGVAFNLMADSLEGLEQLRKTMVADIAHELRTPLTNLRGYLEGLSDGVVPPEKATLEMLQAETLRLVRLVEDLGQLARADAARSFLHVSELDLAKLLGEALALYQPNFEERGIVVETRIAEDLGTVRADGDKLLQALRNLLENAWKYTPEGGGVTVAACRKAAGVRVEIANTGPPIPETDLPYIFERFYRVDRSRSREAGGAGIGLAIVKELIAAHGGTVGALSGEGETRVWFTLPK